MYKCFKFFISVCEYFAHVECQDFAIPDCKENATYVPGKELSSVKHQVSHRSFYSLTLNKNKIQNEIKWIKRNLKMSIYSFSIIGEKEICLKHQSVFIAEKHVGQQNV